MLARLVLDGEDDDCFGVPRAREREEEGPFGGAVLISVDD